MSQGVNMETLKKTKEYTVFKKRSGRFAVRNNDRKFINGEEKAKILAKEKLIKLSVAKPKEAPAPEANAAAEGSAPETASE